MKHIYHFLLTVSIILILSIPTYSQVSFGIKSGVNIATVKHINSDPKNRLGEYGGIFVNMQISKKTSLQPEFFISGKGYKYIGNLNETKKTALRLNYISAPILLGYKIDTKTLFLIGPEIGYLISVREMFPNKEIYNVSKNYPIKFDVGFDIGIDYRIIKSIGISISYSYGFKMMYIKDAVGNRIGEDLAGNRVFQVGFLYFFSL